MANLTYAQLEGYWIAAGGNKAMAPLMAAIALAESSGDPNNTNPTDNGGTQTSWGLWQISLGNHNAPSPSWNDPLTNAKLAVGKYNTQGLRAWGTYTSGKYLQYMQTGVNPTTENSSPVGGSTPITNTGGVTDASFSSDVGGAITDGILSGLKSVLGPVLNEFWWFAECGLGLVIMGIGAFMLIKNTGPVEAIKSDVMKAASFTPEGRAVAVAETVRPVPRPKANVNPYSGRKVGNPVKDMERRDAVKKRAAEARVQRARVSHAKKQMEK